MLPAASLLRSASNTGGAISDPRWVEETTKTEINYELPDKFILHQNYPNPFNPSTPFSFSLPEKGFVQLKIFNNLGEYICTLLESELSKGNHKLQWNATDLSTGDQLETGEFTESKKNFSEIEKLY